MENKTLLPWLVAVAFFMEALDTTILDTAVPAVAQALNVAIASTGQQMSISFVPAEPQA
jgi:MFS family permease